MSITPINETLLDPITKVARIVEEFYQRFGYKPTEIVLRPNMWESVQTDFLNKYARARGRKAALAKIHDVPIKEGSDLSIYDIDVKHPDQEFESKLKHQDDALEAYGGDIHEKPIHSTNH